MAFGIEVGDFVEVISDCMTYGKKGTVTKAPWYNEMVTVHFDGSEGVGLRNKFSTYSKYSLNILKKAYNSDESVSERKKMDSSERRIGVFFLQSRRLLNFESMECADFVMVSAVSVQDAIDAINESDYNDVEFESLLFDGVRYDVQAFSGIMLAE